MKSRTRAYGLVAAAVATALYGASPGAQAQQAGVAGSGVEMEEIIVTAQRREASLQDVPISVSVLQGDILDQRGISDFFELGFNSPNVAIFENNNIAGRTNVTIRGVPGRAGIYTDDVFIGDGAGYNGLIVDVERVEVLRGPQGTLFGRNSIAGVINTVTRRPQQDFTGTAFIRAGNYGLQHAALSLNGPLLADRIAGKISAATRESDGYDDARGTGDVNGDDGYLVTGQLLFTPTESVSVLLGYDFGHDEQHTGYSDAYTDYNINTTGRLLGDVFRIARRDGDPEDRLLPERDAINNAERDNQGGFLRVDWDFGPATLTSITAYRDISFLYTRDGDGSEFDLLSGRQPVDYTSFSQELRIASNAEGPVTWQAGAYYFQDERESSDTNRIGQDYIVAVVPQLAPLAPPLVPGGAAGALTLGRIAASPLLQQITGIPGVVAQNAIGGLRTTFDSNEITSIAAFGSVTWKFADAWELQVGGRYTHEEIDASYGLELSPGLLPFGERPIPRTNISTDGDDDFSPSVSLLYRPSADLTLYATASKGFRSGGFNLAPGPATAEQREFEPETVMNYEVGAKSFLADRRVMLNAAVFRLDYTDFQRSFYRIDPVTGPQVNTFNAEATSQGFEIELSARLTESLTVDASYGLQDATYDDYENAPIASYIVPNPPGGLLTTDLTGEPLPFTPKHTGVIAVSYDFTLGDSTTVHLGTDVQYRSEYNVVDGIDDVRVVDSTALLNAQASVGFGAGWTVTARGSNLTDEQFMTGLDYNNFVGAVFRSLSAPRTYSLELRKQF